MSDIRPSAASPAPPAASYAALTSFILGVVGLVALVVFFVSAAGSLVLAFAGALGLVALVFGIVALRRGQWREMALAGLIVGGLTVLVVLATVVFALLFVGAFILR